MPESGSPMSPAAGALVLSNPFEPVPLRPNPASSGGRASQRLRATLDMNEHGLRAAGYRGEPVGRAEADHFIRAGDDPRHGLTPRARASDAFNNGGMIAAKIREYEFDA